MLHKTIARLIAFSRWYVNEREPGRDDTWFVQPLAAGFSSIRKFSSNKNE